MIFPVTMVFSDAHTLEALNISVYINEDGSARIVESRQAYLTEGTENFIVIGNLGDSEILDFQVKENGLLFEHIDNWNIDGSREEKTNKSGVIRTSSGYELCWGIGEYGSHLYQVEYTITNFVKQFQDKQGIFWKFINDKTNTPPEKASVTIEGDKEFFDSNSNIWAFGYDGDIRFDNGRIVATSNKAFSRNDYLTILVELEDGMYNTTSEMINQPFEEIKDKAFQGSDYGLDSGSGFSPGPGIGLSNRNFFIRFIGLIVGTGINIVLSLGFFIIIILNLVRGKNNTSRKYKRMFKGEYYRDYPYEGNFEDSYYILNNMGISNRETLMTGFILKWIHREYISVEKVERGLIFKKEETALRFIRKDMDRNTVEGRLYNMMLAAAGANEILESNEFTNWAKKNYKQVENWDKAAKDHSLTKLQDLAYIELQEKKVLFFKTHDFLINEKGKEFEERVHKFMNYLYDFSLLNEHESINVGIWDNLMIWAGILGITEVVAKEFKKLYPNYEVESVYGGNAIYMAHSFSRSASRAAVRRSSGGGGVSSSRGGGGSFGGGRGGGTR